MTTESESGATETSDSSSGKKEKLTRAAAYGWGVLMFASAIGFVTESPSAAVFYLLAGVIAFPPIRHRCESIIGHQLDGWIVASLTIALWLGGNMLTVSPPS